MNRLFVIGTLALTLGTLAGAELKIFEDPRQAITTARTEGRLIVFFLAGEADENHRPIATFLADELRTVAAEFVLVRGSATSDTSRALFSGRFQKDLTTLPLAVVTDESGKELASCAGTRFLDYEKVVIRARLAGGKVTDAAQREELEKRLLMVEVETKEGGGSFLAPMLNELKKRKVALTTQRDWTRKDGTVFRAALLSALGDRGVFVDDKGKTATVPFGELSAENIEYLQTILRVE